MKTLQIAHLFLGPHLDHLAWIVLVVTVAESKLTRHVSIAVFERQDRRLVDFDGSMLAILRRGVVDIGLECI